MKAFISIFQQILTEEMRKNRSSLPTLLYIVRKIRKSRFIKSLMKILKFVKFNYSQWLDLKFCRQIGKGVLKDNRGYKPAC